jgi:hypothetical protein
MDYHSSETYSRGKTILGVRAYISASVQTDLFTQYAIKLSVPYRSNQKNNVKPDNPSLKKKKN